MIPPASSAYFFSRYPSIFPITTPVNENKRVIIPIIIIIFKIPKSKKDIHRPLTKASILVAMAKKNRTVRLLKLIDCLFS